jgi:hypothetical protein
MIVQKCIHLAAFIIILFPSFIATGNLLLAEEKPVPVSYNLSVRIEPPAGTIAVRGKIEVPVKAGEKTLQFGLHETFSVRRLLVNGKPAAFSFRPAQASPIYPATRNVIVTLPANAADHISVEIEYRGKLKVLPEFGTFPDRRPAMDDQINARMVELAVYSSWYPLFGVYGHPVESQLGVSLPKGWIAICSGRKLDESVAAGRAVTRWSSTSDTDVLITAAPNYQRQVVSTADGQVEIYYTQLPKEFVDREGADIASMLKLLSQGFGAPGMPSATVKHVFSPKHRGQGRAGISRPGMIVTSEGVVLGELARDPKYSLFQDVAHEVAHFWWNFGAGQGDWINEAFAEYSSAVLVRQIFGGSEFEKILDRYRENVRGLTADAPSLSTVPFDGSGFVVRYYKGSLMLEYLRQTMGEGKFYAASQEFYQTFKGKSVGTVEFRAFWKQALGDKSDIVDAWLDSPGGLPELDKKQASTGN